MAGIAWTLLFYIPYSHYKEVQPDNNILYTMELLGEGTAWILLFYTPRSPLGHKQQEKCYSQH